MTRCFNCNNTVFEVSNLEIYPYTESGLESVLLMNVEQMTCATCSEAHVSIPHMVDLHETIAVALIQKATLLMAQEIQYLCSFLGDSEEELARRCGLATATPMSVVLSPQRATVDRLIRMMVAIRLVTKGLRRFDCESFEGLMARIEPKTAVDALELRAEFKGYWKVRE